MLSVEYDLTAIQFRGTNSLRHAYGYRSEHPGLRGTRRVQRNLIPRSKTMLRSTGLSAKYVAEQK